MNIKPDRTKTVIHNGYVLVYCPEHPSAWKRSLVGYVYEHRLNVEESIGRFLLTTEHVHHINENRSDNRLENLQIMSNAAHARLHRLQKPAPISKLTCPSCQKSFERPTRMTKGRKQSFCSRRCIGWHTAHTRTWRPMTDEQNPSKNFGGKQLSAGAGDQN